ncbi:hypothetical protein C8Q77DRAFT_725254 [Trametes polyzona]|nr:hypothetical protein C8Q77DRAFT_725254 [Trametes polyzona]
MDVSHRKPLSARGTYRVPLCSSGHHGTTRYIRCVPGLRRTWGRRSVSLDEQGRSHTRRAGRTPAAVTGPSFIFNSGHGVHGPRHTRSAARSTASLPAEAANLSARPIEPRTPVLWWCSRALLELKLHLSGIARMLQAAGRMRGFTLNAEARPVTADVPCTDENGRRRCTRHRWPQAQAKAPPDASSLRVKRALVTHTCPEREYGVGCKTPPPPPSMSSGTRVPTRSGTLVRRRPWTFIGVA